MSCPACRGYGYIESGHLVRVCPECARRDWEAFERGLLGDPPCFGYASCSEECMLLCPWGEECREAATG